MITGLSVSPSAEIPAVLVAVWSADADEPGVVEFGSEDRSVGEVAATAQGNGKFSAVRVGLPPETAGWGRVRHGEAIEEVTATTGERGPISETVVTGEGEGYLLTSVFRNDGAEMIPVIFNDQGQVVWWHDWSVIREGHTSRVWLHEGAITYNIFHLDNREDLDLTGLVTVSLDGSQVKVTQAPENHHDFWIHDDGAIAWLQYDWREFKGVRIAGDALVVQSADGTRKTLWSTWDAIPDEIRTNKVFWSMTNSLEYSAADGAYYISIKEVNTVAKVDATTGETLWLLGDDDADVADGRFVGQHGLQRTDDGLMLFDNRGDKYGSRVMTLDIDEAEGTAEVTALYYGEEAKYTLSYGDVLQQGSDRILAWGEEGRIQRIDADGSLRQEIYLPDTNGVAFVSWVSALQ